jgi:hypothetical protein
MGAREIDYLHAYHVESIYHMTHIDNLPSILEHGLCAHGNSYQKKDISNQQVNGRRSRRETIYGKVLHSYVPFYFSPRNAMLFVQDNEDDIVILELDATLIYEYGAIFTDGNASSGGTDFYNDLSDLDKLNWRCIHAKYWNDYNDGRRKKMSEVLIPDHVSIANIEAIICNNINTKRVVDKITNNKIDVFVDTSFYF